MEPIAVVHKKDESTHFFISGCCWT